ncbi:YifB family Mg chelatase-like AAA ATPase [Arcobacter sp. FWKO B]|uniref:YifB family Mg chelatase-like AAA ATPase n=1 Tax=Arcobacter sp. FWKO B TaxID=2593672 RepID=UPI0018A50F0A|nr:YifB family Mg chelatase-like AAA ATPase [Arcobacter sp. FWKO B]QOG12040.1 YifB family Mg chelatase-like AAA ATPase [Arcobacter sp. FWKO B]
MKVLNCATLNGFDASVVEVETTFTKGLPSFSIVGLGNSAIQESKERVKSALLTNNYEFPPLKITINLSPSDLQKQGSHFDLSIALLIALQDEKADMKDFFVFGELGLDGKLKDSSMIFVLALSLAEQGVLKKVLIPKESIEKLAQIPDIELFAVESLKDAIDFFIKEDQEKYKVAKKEFGYKVIKIDQKEYFYDTNYELDFLDIRGQVVAKRGALICASGNHNLMLEGSPGCGKSMIAKRLAHILPPLSLEDILQKAKIDSLDGKEPDFLPKRVFRNPHHSGTKSSIFGGGSNSAKIGEIALANNGMLFFDELPHFSKNILEALREPLEDHKILISRVNSKIEYPTKFVFVAALNPCPCGNLLNQTRECRCSDVEIQRYKNKLSDPLLDRIDLYVKMSEVRSEDKATMSSAQMHEIVLKAFSKQLQRGQNNLNGKLSDQEIVKYCVLDSECENILNKALDSFNLTLRAKNKILKVARTIADLDDSEQIKKEHILEALSFRKRD